MPTNMNITNSTIGSLSGSGDNISGVSHDMKLLEAWIAAWDKRKWGNKPADISRTLNKATEELGEVARGFLKGDKPNTREECADVAIIMCRICRELGGSLYDEMTRKMAILEERLRTGKKENNEIQPERGGY